MLAAVTVLGQRPSYTDQVISQMLHCIVCVLLPIIPAVVVAWKMPGEKLARLSEARNPVRAAILTEGPRQHIYGRNGRDVAVDLNGPRKFHSDRHNLVLVSSFCRPGKKTWFLV